MFPWKQKQNKVTIKQNDNTTTTTTKEFGCHVLIHIEFSALIVMT